MHGIRRWGPLFETATYTSARCRDWKEVEDVVGERRPGFGADEAQALPKVVAITSSDGAHSGQQPGVQIAIKELGGEVRSGDLMKG